MTAFGTDPIAEIARDLRRLEPETRRAVRPRLREAGRMVAMEAAFKASWSSRIPGTIKVVTSFQTNREGVTVRAGGPNAPHARPYEGLTTGSSFRHPVHGHYETWVTQATRPFLFPAAQSTEPSVTAFMREVLDDVTGQLGFSG